MINVPLLLAVAHQGQIEAQQVDQQCQHQLIILQQNTAAEEEARRAEEARWAEETRRAEQARRAEEDRRKVETRKVVEKRAEVKKEVVNKEHVIKRDVVKVTKAEPVKKKVLVTSSSSAFASGSSSSSFSTSSRSLSELHTLRLRLEAAEGLLSQHVHICLGDDGVHDCGLKLTQLEVNALAQKTREVCARASPDF